MPDKRVINISREFSATPFGRYRSDGLESGEVFRETMLIPALRESSSVTLDIDGVAGLPSSFWEEAIGGLIRRDWAAEQVRQKLTIVTTDRELLVFVRLAWRYLDEADRKVRKPA